MLCPCDEYEISEAALRECGRACLSPRCARCLTEHFRQSGREGRLEQAVRLIDDLLRDEPFWPVLYLEPAVYFEFV